MCRGVIGRWAAHLEPQCDAEKVGEANNAVTINIGTAEETRRSAVASFGTIRVIVGRCRIDVSAKLTFESAVVAEQPIQRSKQRPRIQDGALACLGWAYVRIEDHPGVPLIDISCLVAMLVGKAFDIELKSSALQSEGTRS